MPVAAATPAILLRVRRSPRNVANRTVSTGFSVGTMSAPSEAGPSVRPTKTSALYPKIPKNAATSSSRQCERPRDAPVARAIASMSSPASAKRIVESSSGGTDATPSLPTVQLPLQQSATVTYTSTVRSGARTASNRSRE